MQSQHQGWQILSDIASRSRRYLESVVERRVAPDPNALAALSAFDIPLQNEPFPIDRMIDDLDRVGAPATMAIAGPRFFGFVNGGALPGALAANLLSTAWEQHGGFHVSSPGSSTLERVAMRWTIELLGLPADSMGAFATGTTAAEITCLAAARTALLSRVGWDVDDDGLFGAPPITVITSDEGHSTLFKALGVVGLGRRRVIRVPTDDQGRLQPAALPRVSGPTIVCLQAGNVNTGSFDPFRESIDRVRDTSFPVWVHIDGAFGLWARANPKRAHLADGVEGADSWATDGHKWLNTPYDCGMAIVRDREALRRAMQITASYLPGDEQNPNYCDFTLEGSRRPRGVDAWGALRSLGRDGLAEMVERHCMLAARFADGLRRAGFRVLNDVVLNQVLVSFGSDERTREVVRAIQADGTCWCGPTVWRGQTAMRISVIAWNTTEDDVDVSLSAIIKLATAGSTPTHRES